MVYYISNNELYHFGIKGQKWGIRRYQNEDGSYTELGKERYSDRRMYKSRGGTMKKGTIVSRVLVNNKDDVTYDNKKYVSHTPKDNEKWEDLFKNYYKYETSTVMYQLLDDVKIASNREAGKVFVKDVLKKIGPKKVVEESRMARYRLHGSRNPKYYYKDFKSYGEMGSYNLAMQTEIGKAYVDALLKRGYQGVSDVHGQNTAKDPLIIFNPDKHFKKIHS